MFQLDSVFCTVLFCTGIGVTYVLVRFGLARAGSIFMTGVLANSLFFFLFALSRQNSILQAVIVGFGLGLVFTTVAVLQASYFRDTVVTKAEMQAASFVPVHSAGQSAVLEAGR